MGTVKDRRLNAEIRRHAAETARRSAAQDRLNGQPFTPYRAAIHPPGQPPPGKRGA